MGPSRIRCESGLFVGVDRFASQPREQSLNAPGADAMILADYFNKAHPADTWKVLRRAGRTVPTLVNVLKGIRDLIASVRAGSAGIFYYAGHAEVTDGGLVLKTADSHHLFPSDTGLRLSRVLRLFKEEIPRQKYFLLILDCCRSGTEAAAVDDIPPNCCVLYACQHGEVALETASGGVLTRSLVDTFDFYSQGSIARECPLEFVASNLHRQIFAWRPLRALSYDVCGSLVDRLVLPLPEGRQRLAWDADLSLVVKYRFADKQAFLGAFVSIVKSLAEWHSLSLTSGPAREYIDEQLFYDRQALQDSDDAGDLALDVKIPLFTEHRKPSALLATILENVKSQEPETLAIRWPRQLKSEVFPILKHTVEEGEWARAQVGGGHALRWRSEHQGMRFRGTAWVDIDETSTSVAIACETLDAVPVRLKFLLPGMTDLVDLLLAIRS